MERRKRKSMIIVVVVIVIIIIIIKLDVTYTHTHGQNIRSPFVSNDNDDDLKLIERHIRIDKVTNERKRYLEKIINVTYKESMKNKQRYK